MSTAVHIGAPEGYNIWAETWDETPSPIAALEQRMLLPWLEEFPPCRAVDVGCGTGRWTGRLHALGFDISPGMIAVAARKPELRGRLAVADAAALPVAGNVAGLLLCTLTFGHVRNQVAALREFGRVLKPGGALLLTDFHPEAAARGWRRTFRRGGQVYELENHPYTVGELQTAAPWFSLESVVHARIGEPERELFLRAGRPELFAAACRTPAVLLSRWTRL